ncbi:P-loop containing nucleoside triphosphate hydrolases superfamily protein [Striga hermonthica]|uniref:P-loop containing nucleoside triphosphate hydrolases superfamily protein n=1 Tax=Striga hermonthica TaxID=68872 RepID=A0A9N7R3V8_STRHE|nr:P-loop containing nucleoside triphosphate hydrolases superfamily protein [Striga hermonthica]
MEAKDARRRLVQSTLFPRADSSIKACANRDGDKGEEAAEGSQEERGGSKKRSGGKRKGNPKSVKTTRASPKEVIENGEETSSQQDDNSSPVLLKSNFFVKVSERQQEKIQRDQPILVDSPEGNENLSSPPRPVAKCRSTPRKLKGHDNSTPRKERRNSTPNKKMKSGKRELCCKQIPFDLAMDEQKLPTIPDLRLEAKLSAEENSRVFSGRQIHPFFTSWKGGKSSQDMIDSDSKCSSFERKEKGFSFNPIHVFEDAEGDQPTLNWGDWIFTERSAIDDLDFGCSPVYEGSIDSLNFDNFLNSSHFTRFALYQNSHLCSVEQNEVSGLPNNTEHSNLLSPILIAEEREVCVDQQKDCVLPKDVDDIIVETIESLQVYIFALFDIFSFLLLLFRIMSHYHTSQNLTENCLWTDKYQPQNAKQICGNGDSVECLSEWLHNWHKTGTQTSRGCINGDHSKDSDLDYVDSDSDTDSVEESLKNVLLVTGPVGSGKSAAIYACARDQGFHIIEINASDWRNGALVKQKFGEAVESHWLQRTVENATKSENKSLPKFFKPVNAGIESSDDEVIEVTPLSDKKDAQDIDSWPKISAPEHNRSSNCQSEIKTLILFEDVDATVEEDHGFISTIQQLAETAKRPMILTSNSDFPVLPKNLDRLELSFSAPSMDELIGLVSKICAAEKANIHPCLIERFVNYCEGDIRKTIMLLQFWCQGQTPERGNKLHPTYWPLLFDLDAGHDILPRVIHWGHPSQLSERVADTIVKSLTLMKQTHCLTDTKVEDMNIYGMEDNNIYAHIAHRDPIEVKKEAMLSLQCPFDEVECARFDANSELYDFSGSPIAKEQQKNRRRTNMVLSSDSEDEYIPSIDFNSKILETEKTPTFDSEEQLENSFQLVERGDFSQMEYACESRDVSCVPESSFVPETEILNETELYSTAVSYGHFIDKTGEIWIFQDEDSLLSNSEYTKALHVTCNDLEMLENNSNCATVCVNQEEVGDSLLKFEGDGPGRYQPLDECSRMDFMRLKPFENSEADQPTDFVKNAWKKLQEGCEGLSSHVTVEEKTARRGLIFTHGMSDLISDADLLLKDCQTSVFDSLGSSMVLTERTHLYTYYDCQMEMSSVLAQHGICFYAKEIASLGSVVGPTDISVLASEMVSSSSSSVALGKLASQDQRKAFGSDSNTTKRPNVLTSKSDSPLSNILQTIIPSRSYLAAMGPAFHEYISTLSQISKYEVSRLSECTRKKQRRARAPRHYLTSGSLAMTSEEISLLSQYTGYQNTPLSS